MESTLRSTAPFSAENSDDDDDDDIQTNNNNNNTHTQDQKHANFPDPRIAA